MLNSFWKIGLNDGWYASGDDGEDYVFFSRQGALKKAREYLDEYDVDIEEFECFDDGEDISVKVERVTYEE